jgi:carbonic anhydrase/acetyltransferase-like protein (isoleucine patch superfamily)
VWYGAVLRGDHGRIVIGAGTNVQDNATIHVPDLGDTLIGADVTIGHGAVLEGCVVEQGALIGMNAVVLKGAQIGAGSLVAAGCIVSEYMVVPAGVLVAGVPAKIKKPLDAELAAWVRRTSGHYRDLAAAHAAALAQAQPPKPR